MLKSSMPRVETVADYKARLRRIALSIPQASIEAAMHNLRSRAKQVVDAKGKNIPRD